LLALRRCASDEIARIAVIARDGKGKTLPRMNMDHTDQKDRESGHLERALPNLS